jgi:myo-inositol-1(or 4)-monophosphatase
MEHFRSTNLQTDLKKDRSVVTEADLAADRLIARAIKERYPKDHLLSEELQPEYSSEAGTQNVRIWVVDPLDGTTNFSLGLHLWGVSLARLVDGWPETAVLYYPAIEELYSAQKGQGTYLNGQRIQVYSPKDARPLSFFACCSRTYRRYHVNLPYKTRILGSATYTLCAVARGAAILGFEATPKIWDLAAGWLVVYEAGGTTEALTENKPFPVQPGCSYAQQSFPTLAAATPELIQQARHQITPK